MAVDQTTPLEPDNVEKAQRFWQWFLTFAPQFISDNENPTLRESLDSQVSRLEPSLSWEIGPGLSKDWQFVISPNLDRDKRDKARSIVALAPSLPDWEFHSSRQPKDWDYRFDLKVGEMGQPIKLDASGWTFVLLKYTDGKHEVVLKGTSLPQLSDDDKWQAAALVLESVLGEDILLERVDDFDLVSQLEPELVAKERPIRQLHSALTTVSDYC